MQAAIMETSATILETWEQASDDARQSAIYSVLGHKGDIGFVSTIDRTEPGQWYFPQRLANFT
jgi:hypothetical protein